MSTEAPAKNPNLNPTYDFTELDAKIWGLFSHDPGTPVAEDRIKAIDPLRAPDRLGTYIAVGWVEPGKDVFGTVEEGTWGVTAQGKRFLTQQAQKWAQANPPATAKAPAAPTPQTPGPASRGGPR